MPLSQQFLRHFRPYLCRHIPDPQLRHPTARLIGWFVGLLVVRLALPVECRLKSFLCFVVVIELQPHAGTALWYLTHKVSDLHGGPPAWHPDRYEPVSAETL